MFLKVKTEPATPAILAAASAGKTMPVLQHVYIWALAARLNK